MKRLRRKYQQFRELQKRLPPGSSPGMLQPVDGALPTTIRLVAYSPEHYIEEEINDFSRLSMVMEHYPVTWLHITGFQDLAVIEQLGGLLSLHNLSLEDALYAHHRSKIEDYGHYLFIIVQMVSIAEKLCTEQFSMFLLRNCLVTFQETYDDRFTQVRLRMQKAAGRIRNKGVDYLAYALLDAVIDHYYPVLEQCNNAIEKLETDIVTGFETEQVVEIHRVKNMLMTFHRAIWPMREVVGMVMREDTITEDTAKYLRDCYDHVIQLEELTTYCRDLTTGLMDLHLSFSNQRMNETMKFLTLVSTIFIPLSFIASLYGMNFDSNSPFNMPELHWHYGYFYALGLMAFCAAGMFYLFRRRGWIG